MNILITGGTGFIGSKLTEFFLQQNHHVTILSHSKPKILKNVRFIQSISKINANEKINIIVNLAGRSINKRWSKTSYKQILISSRVEVTKNLITLIKALEEKPDVLISSFCYRLLWNSK